MFGRPKPVSARAVYRRPSRPSGYGVHQVGLASVRPLVADVPGASGGDTRPCAPPLQHHCRLGGMWQGEPFSLVS